MDQKSADELARALGVKTSPRLLQAFLDGAEAAKPAAAKKQAFKANARRRRFGKSDRPAQESKK